MKNVLITAPSLKNVSGISTIVTTIIGHNSNVFKYFHLRLGKTDKQDSRLIWLADQVFLLPRVIYTMLRHKIDIIHLNTGLEKSALLRDFLVFYVMKNVFRKKVLFHIHGGYFLMQPPPPKSMFYYFISKMVKESDMTVVLSDIEKEKIFNDYQVASVVLPNAIEPVESLELKKDFDGKITFIFLGRIVKSKGIFLIANSFRHLSEYYKKFDFQIYGGGPEVDALIQELNTCKGLDFSYKGIARDGDKWAALEKSHVFLLPSLHGEGLPIAMLEAMSSGAIPVVSDDASISSVVKDKYNGFIVRKGNEADLSLTLEHLLNDRRHLEEVSQAARSTIREKYNIDGFLRSLNGFYNQLGKPVYN